MKKPAANLSEPSAGGGGPGGAKHCHQIGVFPYLVARPLLVGLDKSPAVELIRAVPSEMCRLLSGDEVEVAMVEAMDLQRFGRPLSVLPAGCLAFGGPTLTFRLFSRVQPSMLGVVWADDGCRTVSALVRILWAASYGRSLRIVPFSPGRFGPPDDAEAAVVVGDRVVADPPLGYDYQIDLGAMWQRMTGLPFVLAVWAATDLAHMATLDKLLSESRRQGVAGLARIAEQHASAYGWPEDLARRELMENLQYELTSDHVEGLVEFFHMAETFGVIDAVVPLTIEAT